jgi:hypothetical protein
MVDYLIELSSSAFMIIGAVWLVARYHNRPILPKIRIKKTEKPDETK